MIRREHLKHQKQEKRNRELIIQKEKAQAELNKTSCHIQVVEGRAKEHIPRYKKYQEIVKFYTPDLDTSSWLRNLESIMIGDFISREDWAYILLK